jgi:hypothetical protein
VGLPAASRTKDNIAKTGFNAVNEKEDVLKRTKLNRALCSFSIARRSAS